MSRLCMVIGTRPQLVKAAVLLPELPGTVLVDTGQHWDVGLAGQFFAELGLPQPDHSLGLESSRTGAMLDALEPVLARERPDVVVVIGDTNSTLAGAIAAADLDIPVAHVEAGVRSFDRTMPEERNRILVDHIATWRLVPNRGAAAHLAREGIWEGVTVTGDILGDAVARFIDRSAVAWSQPYVFATIHRAANRTLFAMAEWLRVLGNVPMPVVLALHPGTQSALRREGLWVPGNVVVLRPAGYVHSLALQLHASAVITDSGGVERESAWLGTPVIVLRDQRTEWPELVAEGRSVHVGLDPDAAALALASMPRRDERIPTGAAQRIASALRVMGEQVAA